MVYPQPSKCGERSQALQPRYIQVDLSGDPADYRTQCPYVCNPGTYIAVSPQGDLDVDGATAPCDPTVPSCPDEAYCTDPFFKGPVVKSCRKTALDPECLYANYNMEHYVENVGGNPSGDWMAIASALKGSILYVSINGAVYSMSTFQPRELDPLATYNGAGMTLIAGSPGSIARVDSAVGSSARFYGIVSMSESSSGESILLTDVLYSTTPARGYLRSIDVTTRDYRVATLSGPSTGTCSASNFVNPVSVDTLSNLVMVVDADCYTIHTYDTTTGSFVVTAGIAGTQGTFDGPCTGPEPGVFDSPQAGIWDPSSGSMLVLNSDKRLKRISNPNTGSCMVLTIASGEALWSGASSLIGGIALDVPGVLVVAGGNEVRTLDLQSQSYTVIAGSYQSSINELFFGWMAGTACGARVALPRQVLRHRAETHGGDSAIYLVDQGNWGTGQTPSIWRYVTPASPPPQGR